MRRVARTVTDRSLHESKLNDKMASMLYVVRDKNQSSTTIALPRIVDPKFEKVVKQFRRVFREELPTSLPPDRNVRHDVDTGDAAPVNLAYYLLSHEHRVEQERQIKDLLEKGLIHPSSSAWGFPVLFVPKPGGKWRMCIDYN